MSKEKLTASQRIEALENSFKNFEQNLSALANEMSGVLTTVEALAKRINATIRAGESGELSNDTVNNIMIDDSIQELKQRVDFLKNEGVLLDFDKAEMDNKTFVVARELDKDKNVISKRMQFSYATAQDAWKKLLKDKKVGDIIDTEEGSYVEIMELYSIKELESNQQ